MRLFLKNFLFTLLVPGMIGVYIPVLFARNRPLATGLTLGLALALFIIGAAIYVWCVWDFATFGRGTPAPIDAPKKLVVRGMYRHTRNPIYVGVVAVLLGWAVMFRGMALLIYAFCVAIGFHLFVLFYEEPCLSRQFGAEYHDYCARVGRWLPRVR
jgi:protein-S-isoprenylcysteine O-methyltransferase Ste14